MTRSTFLASLLTLITAPFTLKSKEKTTAKDIAEHYGYPEHKLVHSWGPPDPDPVTKEYVDNQHGPYHGDWLIIEKDGYRHITHQYINGKWVDVKELI